jgi:hypothetical protein
VQRVAEGAAGVEGAADAGGGGRRVGQGAGCRVQGAVQTACTCASRRTLTITLLPSPYLHVRL